MYHLKLFKPFDLKGLHRNLLCALTLHHLLPDPLLMSLPWTRHSLHSPTYRQGKEASEVKGLPLVTEMSVVVDLHSPGLSLTVQADREGQAGRVAAACLVPGPQKLLIILLSKRWLTMACANPPAGVGKASLETSLLSCSKGGGHATLNLSGDLSNILRVVHQNVRAKEASSKTSQTTFLDSLSSSWNSSAFGVRGIQTTDSLKVPKDFLNPHPEGNRNLANSTVKSDDSLSKCTLFLTLVHRLKSKVKREKTFFAQLLCSSMSESQKPYYAPLA